MLLLLAAAAAADEERRPPISIQSIIGVWEALPEQHPPLLFHMEINRDGESYLVQVTVGSQVYVVRSLISSEIKDGSVRLHFGKGSSGDPTDEVYDVWIVGNGNASLVPDAGVIEGRFCICNNPPPPDYVPSPNENNIRFIKGTWTRDLGEASKRAAAAIRQAISSR